MRLRSEDKHHLRKSADRKAQISPVSETNAFLICAFQSADFLRWCLSSERNLTHKVFFLFPMLKSPVTQPFDRGKTKKANFTKNGDGFEECNVLGNGKRELSAI